MQGLIMAAQLITALSILITIHEFGHFWAARAFGIRVEKFYLFFDAWGFKLFKFKRGDTEWGIGWLPLGGYVKIAGMIDESMDKEAMKLPPQPWEFRSKPTWQRLIVMVGGVFMNLILGVFIFAMMTYYYGDQKILNASLKNGIIPSELAKEFGFEVGDKLISINDKQITYLDDAIDMSEMLAENAFYTVDRNGEKVQIKLPADFMTKMSKEQKTSFFTPRSEFVISAVIPNMSAEKSGIQANDKLLYIDHKPIRYFDELVSTLANFKNKSTSINLLRGSDTINIEVPVDVDGRIGISVENIGVEVVKTEYGFFESFPIGIDKAIQTIALQLQGFGKIFNGDIPANKALQGPIGIAKFYGGEWIWLKFWSLTALISLVLAFMNILPIPALDGGHVVLLIIEMIKGKPLNDKAMEVIQTIGMVILLSLMAFIFGNDILQLFMN